MTQPTDNLTDRIKALIDEDGDHEFSVTNPADLKFLEGLLKFAGDGEHSKEAKVPMYIGVNIPEQLESDTLSLGIISLEYDKSRNTFTVAYTTRLRNSERRSELAPRQKDGIAYGASRVIVKNPGTVTVEVSDATLQTDESYRVESGGDLIPSKQPISYGLRKVAVNIQFGNGVLRLVRIYDAKHEYSSDALQNMYTVLGAPASEKNGKPLFFGQPDKRSNLA